MERGENGALLRQCAVCVSTIGARDEKRVAAPVRVIHRQVRGAAQPVLPTWRKLDAHIISPPAWRRGLT